MLRTDHPLGIEEAVITVVGIERRDRLSPFVEIPLAIHACQGITTAEASHLGFVVFPAVKSMPAQYPPGCRIQRLLGRPSLSR